MAMLDGWIDKLGGLDVVALAGRVGLTEEQVRSGAAALMVRLSGGQTPDGASQSAAGETGIDAGKLAQLVPLIQQQLGGEGGLLGQLGGVFCQGGNNTSAGAGVANQVGDLAKGLFGKR